MCAEPMINVLGEIQLPIRVFLEAITISNLTSESKVSLARMNR